MLGAVAYDLCLTDMRLPDGSGIELVSEIASRIPTTPVAMITAFGNVEAAVEALKAGAFDFVSKPVDLDVLRDLVRHALELNETRRSAPPADAVAGRLLGALGRRWRTLRQTIAKVARSQAPVLHRRRVGRRQGTGRAHHPCRRRARRRSVRAGQLRRDPGRADGERVLRPQEGQLHRRPRRQARPVPDRRRRHAVPRRGRRAAAADAGQAAARDPGKVDPPGRRLHRSRRSTCASSRPRTRTWARWSTTAASATTCTTAST